MTDVEKLVWGDTGMPVSLREWPNPDAGFPENAKNLQIASEMYIKRVCLKGESKEGETLYCEAPKWARRKDGMWCGSVPSTPQELEKAVYQIFCRNISSDDLIQKILEALDAEKVMTVIHDCTHEQLRRYLEGRLAREEG